jgi:hypothetical protein
MPVCGWAPGMLLTYIIAPAANIPPYAVGGALLIVGALMVANVAKIPWDRIGQVRFVVLRFLRLARCHAHASAAASCAGVRLPAAQWLAQACPSGSPASMFLLTHANVGSSDCSLSCTVSAALAGGREPDLTLKTPDDWRVCTEHVQAIPAFLTLAVMPLTYSIAYGVVAGLVAYFIINGTNWLLDNVTMGAKSLPLWVAHARQVSWIPASCFLLARPAAAAASGGVSTVALC